MIQDIELSREDMFKDLSETFSAMFSPVNPDQDYGIAAINRAYADIQQKPHEVVIRAYNLLKMEQPADTLSRMERMHQMNQTSTELGILLSDMDKFISKAKIVLFPPKTYRGESLTEEPRKLIMENRLAPFKAIRDIISYLFGHCGKVALMTQQSMLGFEKVFIQEYIKGLSSSRT